MLAREGHFWGVWLTEKHCKAHSILCDWYRRV